MGRYALLVGISNYSHLKPLPSAVKDIAALQQVLTNPDIGGFAEADVVVLMDVEKGAIEAAIYSLFANRKNDDLLLFYFSGHGVTDSRNDFYFTSLTTHKDFLPPTAVASEYVHKEMNQSRSKYQVLILDCCHSGAFSKGMTAKDVGTVQVLPKLRGEGRAILTASDSSQYAFEQKGFDLSLYTHFLVEGLKTGAADRDGDGHISVDELHEYVRDKVKSVNDLMSPEFYPVREGHRIILAKVAQDDRLKFRKEAQKIIERRKGKILPSTRRVLNHARDKYKISESEAGEIEQEILLPYQIYEERLEIYRHTLRNMVAEEFPLSEVTLEELEELAVGLEEGDVTAIKNQIIAPRQAEYEQQLQRQAAQRQEEAQRLKQQQEEAERQRQAAEYEQQLQRQAAQRQEEAQRLKQQQEEAERQRQAEEYEQQLQRQAAQRQEEAQRLKQQQEEAERQRQAAEYEQQLQRQAAQRQEEAQRLKQQQKEAERQQQAAKYEQQLQRQEAQRLKQQQKEAERQRQAEEYKQKLQRQAAQRQEASQRLKQLMRRTLIHLPDLTVVTSRFISRRNFLILGLTGGGLGGAWALSIIKFPSPQPSKSTSTPTTTPSITPPSTTSLSATPKIPSTSKTFTFETVKVDGTGTIVERKNSQVVSLIYDFGNGVTLDMVGIPAGEFTMGMPPAERQIALDTAVKNGAKKEDAEKYLDWSTPPHKVTIKKSFWMGKFTVTNALWKAVMETEPSKQYGAEFQGDNQPVVGVSWGDCNEFCKKISALTGKTFRLPSEAEWEYACRANTTTPFHFGETITPVLVNYNGDFPYGNAPKGEYRKKTIDVDKFSPNTLVSPNAWGLYQMHGNVWQWCSDRWHVNYNNAPTDGSSWETDTVDNKRVIRGGSWDSYAIRCRSANRDGDDDVSKLNNVGFRLVVS